MRWLLVFLPITVALMLEIAAFVKLVQRFRSPFVILGTLIVMFVGNMLLYIGIITLWPAAAAAPSP